MHRSMIVHGFLWLALALVADAKAQSKIVSDAGVAASGGGALSRTQIVPDSFDAIPTSLNQLQRGYDSTLRRAMPQINEARQSLYVLLESLHRLGLPISLHESAIKILPDKLEIDLPYPENPLYFRLARCLAKYECQLQMIGDELLIVSADTANDPDYFLALSYDTSVLSYGTQELIDAIQITITPDSWSETGQGDQSIALLQAEGCRTLIIACPYSVHLQIRAFFQGLDRIGAIHMNGQSLSAASTSHNHLPNYQSRTVLAPNYPDPRLENVRPKIGNAGVVNRNGTPGGIFRIGN